MELGGARLIAGLNHSFLHLLLPLPTYPPTHPPTHTYAGYTESGPWQYRLEVPFDPAGLKAALTAIGQDGCDIVQQANTLPSVYHHGGYSSEVRGEGVGPVCVCWDGERSVCA